MKEMGGMENETGAIVSIHNIAISAPQILAAGVSGGLFWAMKEAGSQDGLGWVLRIGGCAALIAGWLAGRMMNGERR